MMTFLESLGSLGKSSSVDLPLRRSRSSLAASHSSCAISRSSGSFMRLSASSMVYALFCTGGKPRRSGRFPFAPGRASRTGTGRSIRWGPACVFQVNKFFFYFNKPVEHNLSFIFVKSVDGNIITRKKNCKHQGCKANGKAAERSACFKLWQTGEASHVSAAWQDYSGRWWALSCLTRRSAIRRCGSARGWKPQPA